MKYRNNKPVRIKLNTVACLTLIIIILGWLAGRSIIRHNHVDFQIYAYAPTKILSPLALPTPTPTPTPIPLKVETTNLIHKVWGRDAKVGIALATCESGINNNAVNYNKDKSVDNCAFQINTVHGFTKQELSPLACVSYAYTLYLNQGTTPWNGSKHCWKDRI